MSELERQLKGLDISKMKMSNGKTLEQNLKSEAKRLMNCIQKRIDEYYNSYSPNFYKRTYRFKRSIFLAEDILTVHVKNNTISISIKFNESLAYHPTLWGAKSQVYVPLLINDGWCWNGYNGEEDHFKKYSGFHFIEKGIADFNQNNKFNLKIKLSKTWEGQKYEDEWY